MAGDRILDRNYALNPDVVYLGENHANQSVFLNPKRPNWIVVDQSVAVLLALCDGTKSINETLNAYRIDTTTEKLTQLMTSLIKEKWLIDVDTTPDHQVELLAQKPLKTLSLYVDNQCNLSCQHCFYNAAKGVVETPIKHSDMMSFIDQIAAQGVSRVIFLGGEPLLRSDISEIANYAQSKKLETVLVTNGTLITRDNTPEITEAFSEIQISLDGLEAENDHIRGKGSFHRALNGVRQLIDAGYDVQISCTVSQINIDKLDPFIQLLYDEGVRSVHFTKLQLTGRGEALQAYTISDLSFYQTLEKIEKKWGEDMAFRDYTNLCSLQKNSPKHLCGVGNGSLEIDHNGDIYPCYRLMDKKWRLGNILCDDIFQIYSHSPILKELRDKTVDTDEHCKVCTVKYLCGGNCLYDRMDAYQQENCDELVGFWKDVIVSQR